MTVRHYDDDALVTMLASGTVAADAHLAACGECSGKVESFRFVTEALHDTATWGKRDAADAPNTSTIATLRAFATNMAAEDSAADAFLTTLLAGPRETWMATLAAHPEFRTAGTVRRLVAATDKALDTMPADAVEITSLAVDIAEQLDSPTYRADTLARLRGAAWRERAYALFYTGRFAEAEKAIDFAETHFRGCIVDEYEQARVGIVRAVVDRGLERFDDASHAARASAEQFAEFGDIGREASARLAGAQQHYSSAQFGAAFAELAELERKLRNTAHAQTHALVLGNLGYCAWKLGRAGEAIQFHESAAAILTDLGMHSDAIRTRWNVASILASSGNVDEALKRLERLHEEFDARGMAGAACDVALEMAELLVTRDRFAEAEALCRAAGRYVENAGLAHTARALTALALTQEAVRNRTATRTAITNVREYIRRLPDEPALLFAPPPPA